MSGIERERSRDGRMEREEGESIGVCTAYAVKRIWADYWRGGDGSLMAPVGPKTTTDGDKAKPAAAAPRRVRSSRRVGAM